MNDVEMFKEFELTMVDVGPGTLRVRYGGSGPPLLLHGHPRTHIGELILNCSLALVVRALASSLSA